MNKNVLGKNLKIARQSFGLTQARLAESLGVSASTVGMYEQGRREPDSMMLSRICCKLNVSTDYLLGFSTQTVRMEQEVEDMIDDFTQMLELHPGLKFDGKLISDADREKIIAAIRVAATVVVNQNRTSKK